MISIPRPKVILYILGSAIGLYILALISFYVFHNRLVYQRTTLDKEHKFNFKQPFEEHFIKNEDVVLNALLFKTSEPSKGLIFYLHGNADDLARWGEYATDFTNIGYDVFMFDYRGYGKSTGRPSQKKLHGDASFVLNWVKTNIKSENIVIYGRSLGSALATKLAEAEQPELLILETPFADFEDAIYWPMKPALYLFPIDINFSNARHLANVNSKKVIFHGTDDWVVSLSSAEKLKAFLDENDRFIIIQNGGHRNLNQFDEYHRALKAVLQ